MCIQGRRNTWFCGAYFGFGFHEDGLQSGLAALKELVGEEDFGKYIETLVGLRRDGESLRIITDKELHRSLLERNFIVSLKQAFGVSEVQIISQA